MVKGFFLATIRWINKCNDSLFRAKHLSQMVHTYSTLALPARVAAPKIIIKNVILSNDR
jgi:hypothetical protein